MENKIETTTLIMVINSLTLSIIGFLVPLFEWVLPLWCNILIIVMLGVIGLTGIILIFILIWKVLRKNSIPPEVKL